MRSKVLIFLSGSTFGLAILFYWGHGDCKGLHFVMHSSLIYGLDCECIWLVLLGVQVTFLLFWVLFIANLCVYIRRPAQLKMGLRNYK